MEQTAEVKKPSGGTNKVVIGVAAVVVAAAVGITAYTLTNSKNDTKKQDGETGNQPLIGYDAGATVVLDESSLQAAMDEAMENAEKSQVALQYQNEAFSQDGTTFSCYIVNDPANLYDMFLTIFADAELTDQLFLSGLIPPGSGLKEVTLEHALDPGSHTVYVAVTQVDTNENGEQVLVNQVIHTIVFRVDS